MSYLPPGIHDSAVGTAMRFFVNPSGRLVSEDLFVTGFDAASTTSGGLVGLILSNTTGLSKTIPSLAIAEKVWIEKVLIQAKVTVTAGSTATTYYTLTTNTLRGRNSSNAEASLNLATGFSTQNATPGGYVKAEYVVNQIFNAQPDTWELTFTKTGLGVVSAAVNVALEYRISAHVN